MHRLDEHTEAAAARRPSGNWYEPAFQCTLAAVGVDKILFAVDWPYEANKTGVEFLKKISISNSDREKIAHRNAERLLKL